MTYLDPFGSNPVPNWYGGRVIGFLHHEGLSWAYCMGKCPHVVGTNQLQHQQENEGHKKI